MDAKNELKPSCSTQVYDRLRQPSSPSHIHISTPVFFPCVWNKRKTLLSSSCRVSLHFWSSGAIARSKLFNTDLVQLTIQEAKWQLLLLYCYPEQRREAAHFLSLEAFSRRLRGVLHDPLVDAHPSPLNVPENQALQKYLINGCNRKKRKSLNAWVHTFIISVIALFYSSTHRSFWYSKSIIEINYIFCLYTSWFKSLCGPLNVLRIPSSTLNTKNSNF